MILDLPFPPSTNNLYFNVKGKGRVPTKQYQDWRMTAGWMAKEQKARPVPGPVRILIGIHDAGRTDLDNNAKGPIDLLVSLGLIEGDGRSIVRRLELYWSKDIDGCRVQISSVS